MPYFAGQYSRRRTPKVVEARSERSARAKLRASRRTDYGRLERVYRLNEREERAARAGRWIGPRGKIAKRRWGLGPKPRRRG